MTNWIRAQTASGSSKDLGPLQLAWLGDAVWEMHHRLRYCNRPRRSKDLHQAVVAAVNASAQVEALVALEENLSAFEKELIRKGRNKAGRGPRNGNAAIYAKATGFETMVGWLFLKNPARLAQLLDRLEERDFDR